MALVPHKEDEKGQKAYREKVAKAAKSGSAADKQKLLEENNVHLDGKPVRKVEVVNQ